MRPVYIEANEEGHWYSENCYVAYNGFKLKGYEIRSFLYENLRDGKVNLEPGSIVYGTIRSVRCALNLLGVLEPGCLDIPEILEPWTFRKIWTDTLGYIRNHEELWPVFIKPAKGHKLFTGYVLSDFRGAITTAGFPDDTEVLCSEVVNFKTEYRTFVRHGEILGIKHYKGDPFVVPSEEAIKEMIRVYGNAAPAAYSLDVGVLADGATALVEINDGFALGCYGLPSLVYVKLIEARWDEICNGNRQNNIPNINSSSKI